MPKPRCVALRSHIRILPDGRVPVCQFNPETIGSLLDQSLDELWASEAAARRVAGSTAVPVAGRSARSFPTRSIQGTCCAP